jgi:hypothetical protein
VSRPHRSQWTQAGRKRKQPKSERVAPQADSPACAPQKPRTASGDTLFQVVFMMQTATDDQAARRKALVSVAGKSHGSHVP